MQHFYRRVKQLYQRRLQAFELNKDTPNLFPFVQFVQSLPESVFIQEFENRGGARMYLKFRGFRYNDADIARIRELLNRSASKSERLTKHLLASGKFEPYLMYLDKDGTIRIRIHQIRSKHDVQLVSVQTLCKLVQSHYRETRDGAFPLYKALRERYFPVSLRKIRSILQSIPEYQLFAPRRFGKRVQTIQEKTEPMEIVQIDLLDVSSWRKTFLPEHTRLARNIRILPDGRSVNRGVRYLMTCIAVKIKFAWVLMLKTKSSLKKPGSVAKFDQTANTIYPDSATAIKALLRLWQSDDILPKSVKTDNGNEFRGQFHRELKRNDVNHLFTESYTTVQNSIVERFNRTMRRDIFKFTQQQSQLNFSEHLGKLVKNYNERHHSSHRMRPRALLDYVKAGGNTKVFAEMDANLVRRRAERAHQSYKLEPLQVYDKVRVSLVALDGLQRKAVKAREKSGQTYTTEVFRVKSVLNPDGLPEQQKHVLWRLSEQKLNLNNVRVTNRDYEDGVEVVCDSGKTFVVYGQKLLEPVKFRVNTRKRLKLFDKVQGLVVSGFGRTDDGRILTHLARIVERRSCRIQPKPGDTLRDKRGREYWLSEPGRIWVSPKFITYKQNRVKNEFQRFKLLKVQEVCSD
jgi:hypothetical protein